MGTIKLWSATIRAWTWQKNWTIVWATVTWTLIGQIFPKVDKTFDKKKCSWCDIPLFLMSSTDQQLFWPHLWHLSQMICPPINKHNTSLNFWDQHCPLCLPLIELAPVKPQLCFWLPSNQLIQEGLAILEGRAWYCSKGFGSLDSLVWNGCSGFRLYHDDWLCSSNFTKLGDIAVTSDWHLQLGFKPPTWMLWIHLIDTSALI